MPSGGAPPQWESLATKTPLIDLLEQNPEIQRHVDRAALQRMLDPANYLGQSGVMGPGAVGVQHGVGGAVARLAEAQVTTQPSIIAVSPRALNAR